MIKHGLIEYIVWTPKDLKPYYGTLKDGAEFLATIIKSSYNSHKNYSLLIFTDNEIVKELSYEEVMLEML